MKKIKISFLILISMLFVVSCGKNEKIKEQTKEATVPSTLKTSEEIDNEGFEEGNFAPDFEVKLLSGETVKLSDYKGKVVLLNFWATWCAPCKFEMPEFQKLHEEYGDNLVILAINLGEEENTISKYIEENKFTFNIGIDEMAKIKYPIIALPTTFILDKTGKITLFEEGVPSDDVHQFYKEKIDPLIQ